MNANTPKHPEQKIEIALPPKNADGNDQVYKLELTLKTPSGEGKTSVDSILKTATTFLSALVGTIAVLTASGFVVVNSYLAKFTDVHGYNIVTSQYVTAGIGLWVILIVVGLLAGIFLYYRYYKSLFALKRDETNLENVANTFLGLLGIVFLFTITALLEKTVKRTFVDVFRSNAFATYVMARIFLLTRAAFIALILLISLAGGWVYGSSIYGSVARYLGGGAPTTITLVMKNDIDPSFGILPNADSTQPRRTQTLELLAELNDGLLVRNPITHFVIAIKNDEIAAIVDDEIPAQYRAANPAVAVTTQEATQSIAATADATSSTP